MKTPKSDTNPVVPFVQWPSQRAEEWLARLPARSSAVQAIVIVGSRARECAREESDLDVVVVFDGDRPRDRPPPELDLRWVETSELADRVLAGDEFVGWGIVYGVPVFDCGPWRHAVSSLGDRVPLPSVDLALRRAAEAERFARELLESGDMDAAAEQVLTLLTHEARAVLSRRNVFPASRPELAMQLRSIGYAPLASLLSRVLDGGISPDQALAANEAVFHRDELEGNLKADTADHRRP